MSSQRTLTRCGGLGELDSRSQAGASRHDGGVAASPMARGPWIALVAEVNGLMAVFMNGRSAPRRAAVRGDSADGLELVCPPKNRAHGPAP